MRDKLQKLYGFRYPIQRRVVDERLGFLEKQFLGFEYMINPYHIQPGLLLDVNITSNSSGLSSCGTGGKIL